MPLSPKSFKKHTFTFGGIKKSEKGKSSASKTAVATENIEENRDDVATEDAPMEPAIEIEIESPASVTHGSTKKHTFSFGRIKKSEKGKSSAFKTAVATETIEENRDDVVTEDAHMEPAIEPEMESHASVPHGSTKKHTFSFGRIKKSEKGKSSASQTAVATENIEESRDDVVTEDAPMEPAEEPAMESHASVSHGSTKFLGSLKSLKMVKKSQKDASCDKASSSQLIDVDDIIEGGGGEDAVVEVLEHEDKKRDNNGEGGLERKPSVESQRSVKSALSAKKKELVEEKVAEEEAAKVEAAEEEIPSAPEDPPEEGDPAMKAEEEVREAKKKTHAESLNDVTAAEPKKEAWMDSVETVDSEPEDTHIETVQQEGRVALGYFESLPIEDEDQGLLAQIKQFPLFAAQVMEQHLTCLGPCADKFEEWRTSVTPKVGTRKDAATAESTPEEDDRNDSYASENHSGHLSEDSSQEEEIRVM